MSNKAENTEKVCFACGAVGPNNFRAYIRGMICDKCRANAPKERKTK